MAKGDDWLEIQDEDEVLSDLRTLDTFEIPCNLVLAKTTRDIHRLFFHR